MNMSVIRPSNIIKIYCFNYIFIMPFFIVMLVMDNLGRDHSYIEAIIRWFLIIFIFCIFILMPVWNGKWGFAAMRFKINEIGVAYIKRNTCYYLKWDEIEYIILYPDQYGRMTKNCLICFVADKVPPMLNGYKDFNERAFGVQWRKGLEEIIREYTDKPIRGIEYLRGRKLEERR